jgi:hypothetical protein
MRIKQLFKLFNTGKKKRTVTLCNKFFGIYCMLHKIKIFCIQLAKHCNVGRVVKLNRSVIVIPKNYLIDPFIPFSLLQKVKKLKKCIYETTVWGIILLQYL